MSHRGHTPFLRAPDEHDLSLLAAVPMLIAAAVFLNFFLRGVQ